MEDGRKQSQGEGDGQYTWAHMRERGTKGKTGPRDKRRIQRQGKEPWQDKSKSVQG